MLYFSFYAINMMHIWIVFTSLIFSSDINPIWSWYMTLLIHKYIQFSSVTQSSPTFCDPIDSSKPGVPVHRQLPDLVQTHVHCQQCHPTISLSIPSFSSCLQTFPTPGSFPMSEFFTSGSQSIGASASASVRPMNIQD